MDANLFLMAAALLAVERVAYVWIFHNPDRFAAACERLAGPPAVEPVDVVQWLFYAFKAIQAGVFVAWCHVHGGGVLWPPNGPVDAMVAGLLLIAVGQTLNLAVFHRLGRVGVFYGNRFGHQLPWCDAFPFSVMDHPQYVGALMTIWGFFVLMRFPHPDWFQLPLLETIYYTIGARFER